MSHRLCYALAVVCVLFSLCAHTADASHLRFATFSWSRPSSTSLTVTFYTQQAYRRNYYWNPGPDVGASVQEGQINYGDGVSENSYITVNAVNSQDNWFVGTKTFTHTFPTKQQYTVTFNQCCRLETLADNNAGKYTWATFTVDLRDGAALQSITTTGVPIIYFTVNQQPAIAPKIPATPAPNGKALSFYFPPTTPNWQAPSGDQSGLYKAAPDGFQMLSDGTMLWKPTTIGLFAVQVQITDGINHIPIDFILNANVSVQTPPFFVPDPPPVQYFFLGTELTFWVNASSNNANERVIVNSGALPSGAQLNPCVYIGPMCGRLFRWTPQLGQGDTAVCFTAVDQQGVNYNGQYCVSLQKSPAQIIYVSGIIRDFHKPSVANSHPDFGVADGDSVPSAALFVSPNLGSDGKPVYVGSSSATTSGASNFNAWFNDVANVNSKKVLSLTLSNGGMSDNRIFSFSSSNFYPVDGQLFGNEGDAHNNFFTYELHTYLTYRGREIFNFASSDDMWVFINGVLATNSPTKNLQGVHRSATSTVNLDTFAAANGMKTGNNYRVDIFFAHRGSASTPSIQIQLPNATLCNALSPGFGVSAFSFPNFASASNSVRLLGQSILTTNSSAKPVLRLSRSDSPNVAGAAWFGSLDNSGLVAPQSQQFLNGFQATFNFIISGAAEGFAFVIQADPLITARGDSGVQLGYGGTSGIANSLAIEFDTNSQPSLGDPAYQHISLHSRQTLPNSASETYSLGLGANNTLNFLDGKPHNIQITYTPAIDAATCPLLGWIRVFVDGYVIPALEAQVDACVLKTMFTQNRGYVGFTAANSDSAANVDIFDFNFISVPASGPATAAVSQPSNVIVGAPGSFRVQTKDVCNNKIQVGGDGSHILATLSADLSTTWLQPPPSPFAATVFDNNDGTYTIGYNTTVAGTYKIDVKYDGSPISGSPFSVTVNAGTIVASQSYFVYGLLSEGYSNPLPGSTSGFSLVTVSTAGAVNQFFYTSSSALASAINVLTPGTIVGISVLSTGVASGGQPSASDVSILSSKLGASQFANLRYQQSYALVGTIGSPGAVESLSASAPSSTLTKAFTAGSLSATLVVRSAAFPFGNAAYTQVVPSTISVTAGSASTFYVVSRDQYGNLVTNGGSSPFSATFSPPISGGVSNVGSFNGYYQLSFTTTAAGTFNQYITLTQGSGGAVPYKPYPAASGLGSVQFTVVPGAASASTSTVTGAGLFSATSGLPASFQLTPQDSYGNLITSAQQDLVTCTATAQGGSGVSCSALFDSGTKKWILTYTPNLAVAHTIAVAVNKVNMAVLPAVPVSPGAMTASTSSITAPSSVVLGSPASFVIVAKDAAGNLLQSANAVAPVVSITPTPSVAANVQFTGSGTYTVYFTTVTAGQLNIAVSVSGSALSNSPLAVAVPPGALAAQSYIASVNFQTVPSFSFVIVAQDSYGNNRTKSASQDDSAQFRVAVASYPGNAFMASQISITGTTGSPIYRVTGTATKATTFQILVQLTSGSFLTSQFGTLNPAAANFSSCIVTGSGALGGVELTNATFVIQAVDSYGNYKNDSSDTFSVQPSSVKPLISALGSGRYQIQYTVPSFAQGASFQLTVQLTSGITGTVLNRAVSVVPSSQSSSARLNLPLSSSWVAGSLVTFLISDYNLNQPVSVFPDTNTFAVTATGIGATSSTSSPCTFGVTYISNTNNYTVTCRPTLAGTYRLKVFLSGVVQTPETSNNVFQVTVSPGPVSAAVGSVGGFPAALTAGQSANFTVTLKDQYGNQITAGPKVISMSATPSVTNGPSLSQCSMLADSTYTCQYTAKTAGAYSISVFESTDLATPISATAYSLQVLPAAVSGSHCTAAGSALSSTVAGSSAFLTISTFDAYDNAAPDGGLTITATLFNGATPLGTTFQINYLGANQYQLIFAPTVSGSLTLSVLVGGTPVKNSPLPVPVTSAQVSESNTQVTGFATVTAGQALTFTINAKDIYGNAWAPANLVLVQAFRIIATSPDGTPKSVGTPTTSGVAGQYLVTFANTALAGTYSFKLNINGVIFSTPFTATVIGGTAFADNSIIPAIDTARVNETVTVAVQLRDQFNNLASGTGDSVSASFSYGQPTCDPDALAVVQPATFYTSVSPLGNGAYNISFRNTVTGSFAMSLIINGVTVSCDLQQSVTVTPGIPSAANSVITGTGLSGGVAGQTNTFYLTVNDAFGNRLDRDVLSSIKIGQSYGTVTAGSNWLKSSAFTTITVTNLRDPNSPLQAVGYYQVDYRVTLAGVYTVVVAIDDAAIPFQPNVTITPATVSTIAPFTVQGIVGMPVSFDIHGTDQFGNPVVNRQDYNVTLQLNDLKLTNAQFKVTPHAGFTTIFFVPPKAGVWQGFFQPLPGPSTTTSQSFTISPATCGQQFPDRPYLCPTFTTTSRVCVANYTDCPDIASFCPSNAPFRCLNYTASGSPTVCVTDPLLCPCPTNMVRCVDGRCDVASNCLLPNLCLVPGEIQCPSNGYGGLGPCRKSLADCPTPQVCPPGNIICPDGQQCARALSECVSVPNGDITQYGYATCPSDSAPLKRCPNGQCVLQLEDCPSNPTCAQGQVLCPDGSCKASNMECAQPLPCFSATGLGYRCFDGSCRSSSADCPSRATCPAGDVLCEHGKCAASQAECGAANLCNVTQLRCPDGSCRDNLLLCPTPTTCPNSAPVLCADGECVGSSAECAAPSPCPSGFVTCPDGSCTSSFALCPTRTTCPASAPVRCSSGDCQISEAMCTPRQRCPPSNAVRCPDGSCRTNSVDCPSQFVCPAGAVKCPDGQCVAAVEQCNLAIVASCPVGQVKCPGGECSAALELCPTHPTCPAATQLCADGSCRAACPTTVQTCPTDLVACPQAGSGLVCAKSLSLCPKGVVCPDVTPVKCIDSSCAVTMSQCPAAPGAYTTSKVPCPDGGWETDSTRCGTPVTCTADAPYKCWDDTCRKSPNDCPTPPACPLSRPYLCPDGNCQVNLWDCRTTSTACDSGLRCPDGTCQSSPDSCSSAFPDTVQNAVCPNNRVRCRDGSCRATPQLCPALTCPASLPNVCPDGKCTKTAADCNLPNGCLPDAPTKCWNGLCVAGNCPASSNCTTAGYTRCADGTCVPAASQCNVRQANGCLITEVLCADRRCYRKPSNYPGNNPCIAAAVSPVTFTFPNGCPGNKPYRCPRGYCATSSTLCPPALTPAQDPCANTAKRVLCDDGSCASSAGECALIQPCNTDNGESRCNDGTCRTTCPDANVNTCPAPFTRCSNGLCGNQFGDSSSSCFDDTTGCFSSAPYRCPGTDQCVKFSTECAGNLALAISAQTPANGCPFATPIACLDGSCVTDSSACPAPNGCPRSAPFLCPSGLCKTSPLSCGTGCANNTFTCADKTCKANATDCLTASGCPLDRPFRCADGSCRKFSNVAAARGAVFNSSADACPVTLSCPSFASSVDQLVLTPISSRCTDGTCAPSKSLCSPVVACPSNAPYRCPTGICIKDLSLCSSISVCPRRLPVTCPTGDCVASVLDCPAFDSVSCSSSKPFKCFDGSCKASASECIQWSAITRLGSLPASFPTTPVEDLGICSSDQVLCSNGACAPEARLCTILPKCPSGVRCADGSCASSVAQCPASPACSVGKRCEDGVCRRSCLEFNGCPVGTQNVKSFCIGLPAPTSHLTIPTPGSDPYALTPVTCTTDCARDAKAYSQTFTVDISTPASLDIAASDAGVVQMRLTIPSGSFSVPNASVNSNDNTTLVVRPVSDSVLQSSFLVGDAHLHYVSGEPLNLPFQSAVISPAFECIASAGVTLPFPIPLTVVSSVDKSSITRDEDVCLAQLINGAWQCAIANDLSARAAEKAYNSTLQSAYPAQGRIYSCKEGDIYAFVFNPVYVPPPPSQNEDSWIQKNWGALLGGLIGFGAFVAVAVVVGIKLYTYRKKYHEEREKVKENRDKIEDMELYGARAQDDEAMMANPLARQIRDGKGIRGIQDDTTSLDPTEQDKRKQRQDQIRALESDRKRLEMELANMQTELQFTQNRAPQPMALPAARPNPAPAQTSPPPVPGYGYGASPFSPAFSVPAAIPATDLAGSPSTNALLQPQRPKKKDDF